MKPLNLKTLKPLQYYVWWNNDNNCKVLVRLEIMGDRYYATPLKCLIHGKKCPHHDIRKEDYANQRGEKHCWLTDEKRVLNSFIILPNLKAVQKYKSMLQLLY